MSKIIAVVGCKSTTRFLIENLIRENTIQYLITIDRSTAEKNEVADYENLIDFCRSHQIEVYLAKSYSLKTEADLSFFNRAKIDLCFVMGWQRLIPEKILDILTIGAFGMHGSAMDLPFGRGRSPLNWALIEGRKQFYTNLFKYDKGVDSGDVLATYQFQISDKDTAETLHFKNSLAMVFLITNNLDQLLSNTFTLKPQNKLLKPTYYPKRNPSDSLIDWTQDIAAIESFIRAVSYPFNGSFSFVNNQERIKINSAQLFDATEFGYESRPIAEIVQVFAKQKLLVKCNGGLLLIHDYETSSTPKVGDTLGNGNLSINRFEQNEDGNFDL